MKSLFEFNVYKESSTVEVKKEFDLGYVPVSCGIT